MITLTLDQARQVLAALDEARLYLIPRRTADRDVTAAIAIMRAALKISEQDRAELVRKTALHAPVPVAPPPRR
jgi:hypothetical protein